MIWTVHFAYDNLGWPSFERAAQMINDTGMFIVKQCFIKKHLLVVFWCLSSAQLG